MYTHIVDGSVVASLDVPVLSTSRGSSWSTGTGLHTSPFKTNGLMLHLRHEIFEIALQLALALGVGVFHHLADVVDRLLAVTATAHTATTVFRVGGEIAILVAVPCVWALAGIAVGRVDTAAVRAYMQTPSVGIDSWFPPY